MNPVLLSRVEDAGLNASAPPQQRWLDGWLVRLSPGKAKRARCINAVAPGRMPLAHKLALARAVYAEAGLPHDRAHHALHAAAGPGRRAGGRWACSASTTPA